MALNQQVQDAARLLIEGITAGMGAARTSLGGGGTAFGWTGGMPKTLASYVTTATADGMTFKATVVAGSGTPAAVVAPGAPKPAGTTITPSTVSLKKFAGQGAYTLEDALDSTGLAAAITNVITGQCLKAFETDAITRLDAGAGQTVTGADWVEAVANAQAAVLSNGGQPSVLVLSAANYGAFVADVVAVNAFSQSPDSPVGALLGTPVHISSGAPAGKAYVVDSTAVLAVQHAASPLVIADCFSGADTNTVKIVVDLVAVGFVAAAPGVVEITAPVTALAAAATRKK